MQKIILFDLDGTLIEGTIPIVEGFKNVFKHFDTNIPTDKEIKDLIGHPVPIMMSAFGVAKNDITKYREQYTIEYRKLAHHTTLIEFGAEAINFASKFARLGVVTTKTSAGSKPLLKKLGVVDFFDVIIGADDVDNLKPHKEPIEKALKHFDNVELQNCWMIGDTSLDLQSAKNAGINSAGVLSGYANKAILKKHSSNIFLNSYDAVKYIKES
ncbi:MAG: Phosphoglycolate phosphatase (EC [uncultured Campylobacterales bacterium]|uniref:phosphoglycolate phosphatase n=1 Tax=uncultured Campylobacterales bacterium TaxID=352960 RepID=A0A6S6SIX6_9BACT|nr:MAG: Phosphoglycolate phosphatase (EC [uncultured Campylobacterales bacterium]